MNKENGEIWNGLTEGTIVLKGVGNLSGGKLAPIGETLLGKLELVTLDDTCGLGGGELGSEGTRETAEMERFDEFCEHLVKMGLNVRV